MSEKAEQFKQDFRALLEKYSATIEYSESYGQDEELIGETEYIVVGGERFTIGDFDFDWNCSMCGDRGYGYHACEAGRIMDEEV